MPGRDLSHYRRRNFAHDFAYAFFYQTGAFRIFGASIVLGVVSSHVQFLRIGLLNGLPVVVAGVLFWLINDVVGYWIHRAQHRIPLLWQFHSVHHATEHLTFLTSFRVHPIEQIVTAMLTVVIMAVLGVPPPVWMPIVIALSLFEAVQHADLNWGYGRFYPVLVSPVFHRLHHSRDRADYDTNYSKVLAIWDYAFGTANPSRTPPVAVGVDGIPSERSLIGQFAGPFQRLIGAQAPSDIAAPIRGETTPSPH